MWNKLTKLCGWLALNTGRLLLWGLLIGGYLWAMLAIYFLDYFPDLLNVVFSVTFAVGVPWMLRRTPDRMTAVRWTAALLLIVGLCWMQVRPSNDRPWRKHHAILTQIEMDGPRVSLRNVRNLRHVSATNFHKGHCDKSIDLNKIESVWYCLQNFSSLRGLAHAFLSFGFTGEDGATDYVAISVEIRCEDGERFSPLAGMFRRYELMYVIADERDVIGWRSHFRKDELRLYPVHAKKAQMKLLFVEMLKRAQSLSDEPEFYNTWTNNCANNIVSHIESISPGTVSAYSLPVIFPGYSDRKAYEKGLFKTELPYAEARARFRIKPDPTDYLIGKSGQIVGLRDSFSDSIRSP